MLSFWTTPWEPSEEKVKSPLRYPGGKFYALKHIMPYIACVPHDEYREPFLGGGSVFFGKNKSSINILNDKEEELMNFYSIIQNPENVKTLSELFQKEVVNKQRHSEMIEFTPTNDLERAFRTYFLNRTSYSGIINSPAWGYADGKSSPPQNWGAFLIKASNKLQGVELYSEDFTKILHMPQRGKRVLMYLDPPYYHADQVRAYTKPFQVSDHERLCDELKETPFLFCLSYDDCQEIRELYNWAKVYDVSWLYNTDNLKGGKRKSCKELIITNYEVLHF